MVTLVLILDLLKLDCSGMLTAWSDVSRGEISEALSDSELSLDRVYDLTESS